MRLYVPVAVGDLVGWTDPRAPKQGIQSARVHDVAGPWALVSPEFGPRTGKLYWTLAKNLQVHQLGPDQTRDLQMLLKRAGILPREEGDADLVPDLSSDAWQSCFLCKQALHLVRFQAGTPRAVPVKHWRYCPSCDRTQRIPGR